MQIKERRGSFTKQSGWGCNVVGDGGSLGEGSLGEFVHVGLGAKPVFPCLFVLVRLLLYSLPLMMSRNILYTPS